MVDTLVNAISSLFVVDGKATFDLDKKTDYLKLSKYFIVFLSLIAFAIASKGFDILYLFLLADLFCCAFVFTVFYSFYNKNINEKTAYISIVVGLLYMIGGTKGSLQFPNLKYWFYKNERSWWNKILVNEDKNKKDDNTLVNQIDHFAEVVSKKTKPKVNGNDGLISLKIFAAIKKSAKTGKKVKI